MYLEISIFGMNAGNEDGIRIGKELSEANWLEHMRVRIPEI